MDTLPDTFDLPVRVTEEHIARGERGDCQGCPVALAVLESLCENRPDLIVASIRYAEVHQGWVDLSKYDGGLADYRATLPESVRQMIAHYDEQGGMEPFEGTLSFEKVWR